MAKDFLKNVTEKAHKEIGYKRSPYRVSKEPTRTAQIRYDTLKKVKRIAFNEDRKVVDVLDELLNKALNDGRYDSYFR